MERRKSEPDANDKLPPEHDVAALLLALNTSTSHNRRILFFHLTFVLYVFITVMNTTDLQLLVPDHDISLPLLQIDLPLLGFYIVTPALLLISHFHLLLKLAYHHRILCIWLDATPGNQDRELYLPPFLYNMVLAYPSVTPRFRRLALWYVVMLPPPFVLLALQMQFAAYHSLQMTTFHFVLLATSAFVVMRYRRRFLSVPFDVTTPRSPAIVGLPGSKTNHQIDAALHHRLVSLFRTTRSHVWRPTLSGLTLAALLGTALANLVIIIGLTQEWFYTYRWLTPTIDVGVASVPQSDFHFLSSEGTTSQVWRDLPDSVDLRGRDLQGATLTRVRAQSADLRNANLSGADLYEAVLPNADLRGADLSFTRMTRARLQGALLTDVKFHRTTLVEADLSKADLSNAVLRTSPIHRANFEEANLSFVHLEGAYLFNPRLRRAKATGIYFTGARVSGGIFEGADLTSSVFTGALVQNGLFDGADLRQADFQAAVVSRSRFRGAELQYVAWQGAEIVMSGFEGSLYNASFTGETIKFGWGGGSYRVDSVSADTIWAPDVPEAVFALTSETGFALGLQSVREMVDWQRALVVDTLLSVAEFIPDSVAKSIYEPFSDPFYYNKRDFVDRLERARSRYTRWQQSGVVRRIDGDFNAFLNERKELACTGGQAVWERAGTASTSSLPLSTWAAEGMLVQGFGNEAFYQMVRDSLIIHMDKECSDVLETLARRSPLAGASFEVRVDDSLIRRLGLNIEANQR